MPQKGLHLNLEEMVLHNTHYRAVVYTTPHMQLVLMTLQKGEEIGEEIHTLDQFIRVESGNGVVVMGGEQHTLSDGYAVIIPRGVKHNVINTGTEPLKLYSIYTPPEHKDGTIHVSKADEIEEHFDGDISQ